MKEWFGENTKNELPRLIIFMFKKLILLPTMVIVAQGIKKHKNTTQKLLFKGLLFFTIVVEFQFLMVAKPLV